MVQHLRWLAGAWIGVASILGGCEAPPPVADSSEHGVVALQFDDIPVPDGLTLSETNHRSDSLVIGEYRYANFVYKGWLPTATIATYLRERMPQHSWTLIEDSSDERRHTLRFRRGKYAAECVIADLEDAPTQLTVRYRTPPVE